MFVKISKKSLKRVDESGAALVIALLVMTILLGFAALVLSRTTTENTITLNDTAESRSFNAAEAALEDATRDFATVVEQRLNPTDADIDYIKNKAVPYFSTNGYTFTKVITPIGTSQVVTQTKGQFQGLISLRDEWQIDITAKDNSTGVVTQVRRRFFNDRIPIFQFGAFYQDDLEVQDPPLFIFNGRIHTNGNFFTNSNGNDIRYKSKITVAGEIVRDRWKSGAALLSSEQSNAVYAPNATNNDVQLPTNRGSVTCSSGTGGILRDITGRNFPYPNCVTNPNWASYSTNFEGNVVNKAKQLTLPVSRIDKPLIEMVRRGKNIGDKANIGGSIVNITSAADEDDGTLSRERFANKEGIRISLADSKDKLPQCANVLTECGVRLDGTLGSSLGYQPKSMTDYTATALNGNRIAISGREVWIKVELVSFDYNNQRPITKDVTQDILSLGVTDPLELSSNLQVAGFDSNTDSRSVIKLQRYAIKGDYIPNYSTSYLTNQTVDGKTFNFVVRKTGVAFSGACSGGCNDKDAFAASYTNSGPTAVSSDESYHFKTASFNGGVTNNSGGKTRVKIVPFPIEMFDVREGNRDNSTSGTVNKKVYVNGVMSLVDIDVANLRRFLNGEFDGKFPTNTPFAIANNNVGLKSTDVPQNRGWVLYFSDRRGDANFDGRYNMEDVNPNYDSIIDEDLNGDGVIDKANSSNQEAPLEDSQYDTSFLAVTDHKFYRRGIRLINAQTLPGKYDTANEENTRGFTVASENGVYTWKNYNVSSVSVAGGTSSTTSDRYYPQDSALHIPAAIIGDAVTVLSNNWNDGESFAEPYTLANRPASDTQVRFAMLAGDPITGYSPSDGLNGSQNGGLINFKRFLETWTNDRLNYSGSLINLFNAFNNNARHKPNGTIYNPPTRDWTFEESFKNPNRLPPGTPFVYFLTFTGFERVND
jgi:type II secretory pathway pseudopilin PulG